MHPRGHLPAHLLQLHFSLLMAFLKASTHLGRYNLTPAAHTAVTCAAEVSPAMDNTAEQVPWS